MVADPLRVLAIGDSLLAWHKWTGRDVPAVMGDLLGAKVVNASVAGARFSDDSMLRRSAGFEVRAQFRNGSWDIVLINGGANDFLGDCNCGACDSVLDSLISSELTGEVPSFVTDVLRTDTQVLWMGYYASARLGPFEGCRPFLEEYDARVARLAAQTPGMQFVDSEDVVTPNDASLFAFDGIHPSAKGARLIGAYLAQSVPQ